MILSRLIHGFKRQRFFVQELMLFLLFSVIPVLIFLVICFNLVFAPMQRRALADTSSAIRQVASSVDLIATQYVSISTSLSFNGMVQNYLIELQNNVTPSKAELYALEQNIANFFNGKTMRNIILYDNHSNVVKFPVGIPGLESDFMAEATNGVHRKIVWTRDSKSNLIRLIRVIESTRMFRSIGYLEICIYPEIFSNLWKDIEFNNRGTIFLVDEKGRVMAGSETIDSEVLNSLERDSTKGEIVIDGTRYYLFAEKSSVTGWYVVGLITAGEALKDIWSLSTSVLLSLIILIVLVFFVSLAMSRFFSHRIDRVVWAMSRFAQGDRSIELAPFENPDFNSLSSNFNHMVKEFNQLIDSEYTLQLLRNQMELKMLRAQINPHFLYNTLNAMYWKAQIADNMEIANMCMSLGNLFHASIDQGKAFVTLREEIDHLKDYVYIQKMRYGDRVSVDIEVEEEIMNFMMPSLVLQPVVENAYVHGLEPKRGEGSISVSGVLDGDDILFVVKDDGVGMKESTISGLFEEKQDREFQALMNVHRRLQLIYGKEYGITVASVVGEGTEVRLRIRKEERHVSDSIGR